MTRVLTDIDLDETDNRELAPEALKVVDFRNTWLRAAGYNRRNANRIAYALSIDWHFAVDLRKKCENEDLCMRILFGGPGT